MCICLNGTISFIQVLECFVGVCENILWFDGKRGMSNTPEIYFPDIESPNENSVENGNNTAVIAIALTLTGMLVLAVTLWATKFGVDRYKGHMRQKEIEEEQKHADEMVCDGDGH